MAITLCMIVRDEAARLPQCLASVVGVVDEAVIVDTGSQDETVAIARQWGARVYEVPWQEDFAAARNIALQYVTTEWVLVLDADETLTPSFAAVLPEICRQPNWLVVILLRQELGVVPPYTYVSRLFRHHPDLFFQRPYHETIDDSVLALQQREPHWQIGQVNRVALCTVATLVPSDNKSRNGRSGSCAATLSSTLRMPTCGLNWQGCIWLKELGSRLSTVWSRG